MPKSKFGVVEARFTISITVPDGMQMRAEAEIWDALMRIALEKDGEDLRDWITWHPGREEDVPEHIREDWEEQE